MLGICLQDLCRARSVRYNEEKTSLYRMGKKALTVVKELTVPNLVSDLGREKAYIIEVF